MTPRRWARGATVGALLALLAPATRAQEAPWLAGEPDPLRGPTLPFTAVEAEPVRAGAWRVVFTTSMWNHWKHSNEILAVHRSAWPERLPLTAADLAATEERFPGRDLYWIDLEGSRTELVTTRGLPGGLSVSLRIPWLDHGAPASDGVVERYHRITGLGRQARDLFPRGESHVYVSGRRGRIAALSGLSGSGLGDISVAVAAPLGAWLGGEQRGLLAVEAPTGAAGTLFGSGGWDLGARAFSIWTWRRAELRLGAGYTRPSLSGTLLGVRRGELWHAALGIEAALGARTRAALTATYQRSPFAAIAGGDVGHPALLLRYGLTHTTRRGLSFGLELGQDLRYGGVGVAPDTTLQLVLQTFPR
ncbi:MAG: hypothetical protein HY825_12305 [Acidobacteria bacterium]|nr:hypothetical protein [Acidobacteriota bacterium]